MAAVAAVTAAADGWPKMVFELSDGSVHEVGSENLKIVFQNGDMVASNASESLSLPLADLAVFYFSGTSGISGLMENNDEAVEVFTPAGICLGSFGSESVARQQLPKGVYLLKSNGSTRKVFIR